MNKRKRTDIDVNITCEKLDSHRVFCGYFSIYICTGLCNTLP